LCLTRFYRDPAGGAARSGEATGYAPAFVSLMISGALPWPCVMAGIWALRTTEFPLPRPGSRALAAAPRAAAPAAAQNGAWTV